MSLQTQQPLPSSLEEAQILRQDGSKVLIAELYSQRPTLLVFVRHFACIGCTTQMMAIGPRVAELDKLGIGVKVIGNGQPHFIEGFIDRFKLSNKPVEVFTDPTLNAYKEARLRRSFWRAFGPPAWIDYLMAFSKGIGQKGVQGDNLQMGGTLFVNQDGVLEYYFQNSSVANIADPNEIIDKVHQFVLRNNPNLS